MVVQLHLYLHLYPAKAQRLGELPVRLVDEAEEDEEDEEGQPVRGGLVALYRQAGVEEVGG